MGTLMSGVVRFELSYDMFIEPAVRKRGALQLQHELMANLDPSEVMMCNITV